MSEWKPGRIGDLVSGIRGVTYDAGQLLELGTNSSFMLLRANNIDNGKLNYKDIQIVPEKIVTYEQKMCKGDIAVCMSNGSRRLVGKSAQYMENNGRLTVGAFCSIFRPLDPSTAKYARYLFQCTAYKHYVENALSGTAINNLTNKQIEGIPISIPPNEDQIAIARILDTLDSAIQETESLIEKLKAIKQGLLHDLLTRGVDENGKLRPPREEAPELYKESELGWIPREWEAMSFSNACSLIRDGTHLPPNRITAGPLLLSVRNMINGKFIELEDDTHVSYTFFRQMHSSWKICKGDVLLAIVGATIGKTAVVDELPEFTIQRSVAVLRGQEGFLDNVFLSFWVQQTEFLSQLWRHVNQTAQPGIYLNELGSMEIAVPSISEQEMVATTLVDISERIIHEQDEIKKRQLLKAALLNDLLTGRVRVTSLLAAHPELGQTRKTCVTALSKS